MNGGDFNYDIIIVLRSIASTANLFTSLESFISSFNLLASFAILRHCGRLINNKKPAQERVCSRGG